MTTTLATIPLKTIDGGDATIADYDGQVLLVVNVASECGLTKQYEGLQSLYAKYHDEGFTVLAFPANDFAGQEPGDDATIAAFARDTFGADFPLFAKISVTGPDAHPLYRALTDAEPVAQGGGALRERLATRGHTPDEGAVLWNFEKFLIGRDGQVVARFAPDTAPDDAALVLAVERELFASE